jgi:hypothetical protein
MNALQRIDQLIDVLDLNGKAAASVTVNASPDYILKLADKRVSFLDGFIYRGHKLNLPGGIDAEVIQRKALWALNRFIRSLNNSQEQGNEA